MLKMLGIWWQWLRGSLSRSFPVASVNGPIFSAQDRLELGLRLSHMCQQALLNPKASESIKQGDQASRYLGSGMEYEESREYHPGDEVRRINWRLMARTGVAYTKLFQEERQEAWTILLDQRQSMRFGTQKRLKVQQAIRVLGFYSWQAETIGLPVEAICLSETIRTSPIYEGRGAFEHLMDFVSIPCPPLNNPKEVSLNDELLVCQRKMQAGSRLILISDFHDIDDKTLSILAALQDKVMVKAILIYDRSEKHLPRIPGLKLESLNGGFKLDSLTASQQNSYDQWSLGYFKGIRLKLASVGVTVLELRADDEMQCLNEQKQALKHA